jgi:hypothetical protein
VLMKSLIVAVTVCFLSALPVVAGDGPGNGGVRGGGGAGGSGGVNNRGAPGPIAGAGLPFLAAGYGVYWLIRRRRKAD